MRTRFFLVIVLAGCASAASRSSQSPSSDRILGQDTQTGELLHTQSSDGPVAATVHASTDAVWGALTDTYNGLGIELTVVDKGTGTIGNRSFVRSRTLAGKRMAEYFECGQSMTGSRADEGRLTISAVSNVSALTGGESRLSTTVTAVVTTMEGASAQNIPCSSTGMLEEAIRNTVVRRIGGM